MEDALEKRLNELALRAAHSGRACYTRFLEPSALGLCKQHGGGPCGS